MRDGVTRSGASEITVASFHLKVETMFRDQTKPRDAPPIGQLVDAFSEIVKRAIERAEEATHGKKQRSEAEDGVRKKAMRDILRYGAIAYWTLPHARVWANRCPGSALPDETVFGAVVRALHAQERDEHSAGWVQNPLRRMLERARADMGPEIADGSSCSPMTLRMAPELWSHHARELVRHHLRYREADPSRLASPSGADLAQLLRTMPEERELAMLAKLREASLYIVVGPTVRRLAASDSGGRDENAAIDNAVGETLEQCLAQERGIQGPARYPVAYCRSIVRSKLRAKWGRIRSSRVPPDKGSPHQNSGKKAEPISPPPVHESLEEAGLCMREKLDDLARLLRPRSINGYSVLLMALRCAVLSRVKQTGWTPAGAVEKAEQTIPWTAADHELQPRPGYCRLGDFWRIFSRISLEHPSHVGDQEIVDAINQLLPPDRDPLSVTTWRTGWFRRSRENASTLLGARWDDHFARFFPKEKPRTPVSQRRSK